MIYCVLIGASTGFIFLMVMLFVSGGASALDNVISNPAGPLLEIFYTATNNRAGKSLFNRMGPQFMLMMLRSNLSSTVSFDLLAVRNLWYHDYILKDDMGIRTRQRSPLL